MKIAKTAGMFLLPAGLVLATTGCGGNDLLADPKPSPSETAAAPTFTAEQQEASKYCLSADEQKALQPGAAEIDTTLIDACRKLGQSTYDGLGNVNKTQEQIAKLADELKTTTSLARATQIVNSLGEAKRINDQGVTITNKESFSAQLLGLFPNATKEDIEGIGSFGENAVDPAKHNTDTGGAPFYDGNNITYLDSTDTIAKWFASGTPGANTAKERVISAIKAAGKGDKEVDRALSGAGYIDIQLKGESQIMGGSYFVDGKFHQENTWRQSKAGDIYWLYITEDGILIPDAILRADCGNVGAKQIRIVKINIPRAVPVGLPPGKEVCPEGTVLQPNGECHLPPPVADCTATPTLPECLTPKTNGIWIQPLPNGDGTTDSEGQWQQYGPGEFTGSTPPEVITQQPGTSSGGTVVDSATKAPSSETGGSAPGVTPEVKPSKPAETGANDSTVQNPDQPEVGGNDGHIDNPFG